MSNDVENVETPEVENTEVVNEETQTQELNIDEIGEQMMQAAAQGDTERFAELETLMSGGVNANDDTQKPQEEADVNETEESDAKDVVGSTEPPKPIEEVNPTAEFLAMQKALEESTKREQEALRQAQQFQTQLNSPKVEMPKAPTGNDPEPLTELPELPVKPNIPIDPSLWEEEHIALYKTYEDELAKYQSDSRKFLAQMGSTTADLQKSFSEQQKQREDEVNAENQRKANEGYWNSISAFQNDLPSFKTDRSISEIHTDIDKFGGQLAALNGFAKGTQQHNAEKERLVLQYKDGNQQLLEQAQRAGLQKPAGFDEYMGISEVSRFRSEAIDQGELGKNASMKTAYLLMQEKNGTLAETFNDVAVSEREKAHRDRAEKIQQANQSVRTPSNTATTSAMEQAGNNSANPLNQLTAEELAFYKEVVDDPYAVTRLPNGLALMDQIEKKLK